MDHLAHRNTVGYEPIEKFSLPPFLAVRPMPNSVIPQPAAAPGTFERFEDKFMVPAAAREVLLAEIRARMPVAPYSGKSHTELESVYFDSPELTSFTDHFQVGRDRFKLRTRRYGPDGQFKSDGEYHLELKTKGADGVSRKMRFRIAQEDFRGLGVGKPLQLWRGVSALNPEIETKVLVRRLNQVNELVTENELRPVMRVSYDRVAFEAGSLRVTLDENIDHAKLGSAPIGKIVDRDVGARVGAKAMRNQFDGGDYSLLEVKHAGKHPDWLSRALSELRIGQKSFSKYCYSVATAAAAEK